MNFQDAVEKYGWTPEQQVFVLLEYIDNQNSPEAFEDFLEDQPDKPLFSGVTDKTADERAKS